MKKSKKRLLIGLVFGAAAAASQAAVITIAPGNVSSSSEIPGFDRIDDYIVDGSGLTGATHNSGANAVAWLSSAVGFGGEDTNPSITFDLGDVYTISSFNVWNYNENATGVQTTRGINSVSIEYGATGALGATVPGISNLAIADGTATYTGENFSSFTPFDAQFIKFDINSNHGDANVFYGLSEVQFDGVLAPIPEPGSTALLGLAAAGMVLRRRRRS